MPHTTLQNHCGPDENRTRPVSVQGRLACLGTCKPWNRLTRMASRHCVPMRNRTSIARLRVGSSDQLSYRNGSHPKICTLFSSLQNWCFTGKAWRAGTASGYCAPVSRVSVVCTTIVLKPCESRWTRTITDWLKASGALHYTIDSWRKLEELNP